MVIESAPFQKKPALLNPMQPSHDILYTLLGLLVCAVLGTYGFWRHFRKHDGLRAPVVPWMIVSLACLATGFMVFVHLVNLLGIETGR